jgi:MFS superfamily sulfate permease-like transporter
MNNSFFYHFKLIKRWISEGIRILFYGNKTLPDKIKAIEAHHLAGLLIAIFLIYLLSHVIAKIFMTVVKLVIMIFFIGMLWMIFFDRQKYNELFQVGLGKGNNDSDYQNLL